MNFEAQEVDMSIIIGGESVGSSTIPLNLTARRAAISSLVTALEEGIDSYLLGSSKMPIWLLRLSI